MLRASASLSTLRAALRVRDGLPTPAVSESFTSRRVERLSLKRRTALQLSRRERSLAIAPRWVARD
eukprot:1686286-Pleurochrysis_carterae.AAC.1